MKNTPKQESCRIRDRIFALVETKGNVRERRRGRRKGGGDAMKYIKQPKRHIVLDDFEWRALVKGINEYRKQVIDEDGCIEVVNELLLKIIDAPTKKIMVMVVSKFSYGFRLGFRLMIEAVVIKNALTSSGEV